MKTRIFKILLLLLTIALFSVYVNAFAVSMPYLENRRNRTYVTDYNKVYKPIMNYNVLNNKRG